MPSRLKIACVLLAMPTTFSFSLRLRFSSPYCARICSISRPPTVPTPQIKRLRTLYSERKNESCMTFKAFRKLLPSTTNDMLVSNAPCEQAITLMPLRPSVPNSLPATPGVCLMFSPTTAIVASPLSACIGNIAPVAISPANSSSSTLTASSASSSFTAIDVEFSEEAWLTRNTDMPLSAKAVKIRRLTPMTPTIDKPVTVIKVVWLMLDIPLITMLCALASAFITVPVPSGLKVFFTNIGMFFTHTG